MKGGRGGITLTETGTDLGGMLSGGGTSVATYDFDPFSSFSLSLGTFLRGDSSTLETVMTASVSAFDFELGAEAFIGDPGDVTGGGFGGDITATPGGRPPAGVPDSGSSFALLGLSLGGVVLLHAKKKSQPGKSL